MNVSKLERVAKWCEKSKLVNTVCLVAALLVGIYAADASSNPEAFKSSFTFIGIIVLMFLVLRLERVVREIKKKQGDG